jgi:transposase
MKKIKVNRSYKLKLFGSESKFEDLRWSAKEYTEMTRIFAEHLYFQDNVKYYSTKGMGLLGNQAQQKALGMVKSKKSLEKDFNHKKSVPLLNKQLCFANIEKQSTHKHFNYKINFSRFLFAKGTKPLKIALRQGWKLSDQCEIFFEPKDNHWYVHVFVSKEVNVAQAKTSSIGIDVGINHIIATSEGFLGNSLSKRLRKINESKKEKQRQFSIAKNRNDKNLVDSLKNNLTKNKQINKTIIKQLLDKEAKKIIARGLSSSSNLVVEDPKVLANLKSKGLMRWAKTYFAYRLQTLGQEKGVFVVFTHPAYTSITCTNCGNQDKENREGLKFHCVKCGHKDHADINGSKNLSRKGQDFVDIYVLKSKPALPKNISKSAVGSSLGLVKSTSVLFNAPVPKL